MIDWRIIRKMLRYISIIIGGAVGFILLTVISYQLVDNPAILPCLVVFLYAGFRWLHQIASIAVRKERKEEERIMEGLRGQK